MKKLFKVLAVLLLATGMLSGCTPTEETTQPQGTYAIEDGTYQGVGAGFEGDIVVDVTFTGGEISDVVVVEHSESRSEGVEQLPALIVENGIEAEAISGATVSSDAIKAAILNAVDVATGNVETVVVEDGKQIIVVGGGNSGMTAAYYALEAGKTVVLFEKQGKLGGTFGGGTWITTGSDIQIAQGITNDSVDAFKADIERLNESYQNRTGDTDYWVNEELTTYFGEQMAEVTNWMEDLGAGFSEGVIGNPTLYEPHDVMRVLSGGDRQSYTDVMIEALQPYLESGQLQIVMNSNVDDIIIEDGAVSGVVYTLDGQQAEYKAPATVLATGGYGFNPELITRAGLENYTSSTPAFQTGDGYLWAEEAGAELKNMDFITTYAAGIKTEATGLAQTYAIRVKEFGDIIFVNSDGERFIDEFGPGDGSTYDAITSEWKKQEDNYVYIAVSQSQIDAMKAREASLLSRDSEWTTFETLLAEGEAVFQGATAEEAAEKAGIDATAFAETITKYNGYVDAGVDADFGRENITTVKSNTGEMVDLGRDTFTKLEGDIYLIRTNPYIMICAGGVDVNTDGQALDANREPIEGLFITGEMVGMANAFGRTTIGGVGNTGSSIWGKMAGEGVAKYIDGLAE